MEQLTLRLPPDLRQWLKDKSAQYEGELGEAAIIRQILRKAKSDETLNYKDVKETAESDLSDGAQTKRS